MLTANSTQTDFESPLAAPGSTVAAAFDSIAGVFDSTLENEITRHLRSKIYSVIATYVGPGSSIFDVNCGTGIDALELSRKGYRVAGSDISANMIAATRGRMSESGIDGSKFTVSSFEDLASRAIPPCDLVFSNFGGMNCTADLQTTARSINSIVKPGGYFIGVLMPPFSVWEFLSFAIRFRFSDAIRRLRPNTPATGFREWSFPVHYYSPGSVEKAFSDNFVLRKITGLSVFAPTPQSTGFFRKHPQLSRILNALDDLAENLPLIRSIGDHYIIIMQKTR